MMTKKQIEKYVFDSYEPYFISLCEGLFAHDMFEEVSNSARYARLEQLDNDEWEDFVIPYHCEIFNETTVSKMLEINKGIQSPDLYQVFKSLIEADKWMLCINLAQKHSWPIENFGINASKVFAMWKLAAALISLNSLQDNTILHQKLLSYIEINNLSGEVLNLFEIAIQSTSEDPWDGL